MYLTKFLSVMALAIMGTNAAVAAVAAEPKIGLEERACFCNYGDGTYPDCVAKAEAECAPSCVQEQAFGETAYAICVNDCANMAQGINCCGC